MLKLIWVLLLNFYALRVLFAFFVFLDEAALTLAMYKSAAAGPYWYATRLNKFIKLPPDCVGLRGPPS
jgi:hypothetical protein